MKKLLTCVEAGERLNLTAAAIRYLIRNKRLRAVQIGRAYLIEPANLRHVKRQKPGRKAQ